MDAFLSTIQFLKNALLLTFGQVISVFGVVFFFGILLYLLARFTRVTFVKSIGQRFDVYFTGWIGTPIHELGHALFCIPFGHKIVSMKLFSPNTKDGSLGFVNHQYNPRNIWHLIGNFFIGIGPVLFGSLVLFLLIKFLIPDNEALLNLIATQKVNFTSWQGLVNQFLVLYKSGIAAYSGLFTAQNLHSWQFWVFLYPALSISSHMELSPSDLKSFWSGFLAIFIVAFLANSIFMFFGFNTAMYISYISSYSQMTAGIFTISTLISAMFFVSSYVVLNAYTLIRHQKLFHPFA